MYPLIGSSRILKTEEDGGPDDNIQGKDIEAAPVKTRMCKAGIYYRQKETR